MSRLIDVRPLRFCVVLLIPLVTLTGWLAGGPWVWAGPAFVFIASPLADALFGRDVSDVPEAEANRAIYTVLLWLWAAVQGALALVALATIAGRSPAELVGLAMSWGVVSGGVGITVAHELMHRRRAADRGLAELLMVSAAYPHFCIEHVMGHHKNVATPADAASAELGLSVYAFLPRTLWGGLRSAYHLESQRVHKLGCAHSWADRRWRHPLLLLLLAAAIGLSFGGIGVAVWLGQAVTAILLLEVINYVEHYGLRRKRRGESYEPVAAAHSWSAPHRLSCWYLFNLPRHADHHFRAHRPYPVLRHLKGSPELPAGYPTMLLSALVPPLWFAMMNPRVRAWNDPSPEAGSPGLNAPVPQP